MFEVPPQQILSTDSVTLTVDAVIYYRVFDPVRAACKLQDYNIVSGRGMEVEISFLILQVDVDVRERYLQWHKTDEQGLGCVLKSVGNAPLLYQSTKEGKQRELGTIKREEH